jgi:DNA-binding transcriptional LysR family regulator
MTFTKINSIDWNDLRYLLAVVRSGSPAGAARQLGVSHATVLRRIQLLEKCVGSALFNRLQSGYVPTAPGLRFAEVSEAFERTLASTQLAVEDQRVELAGVIRFNTTDTLACSLMPGILTSFRARYPQIRVDMRIANARLEVEKSEADVALRPTSNPPASMVGRCVRPLSWGLYAAPAYLARQPDHAGAPHDWLMPGATLVQDEAIRHWLEARVGGGVVAATADSFLMLSEWAACGMGVALLPSFMGQGLGLVLLEQPQAGVGGGLWLLTYPHLRYVGRIRAFMEHVTDAVRELEALECHSLGALSKVAPPL